jgi:hypothetical protein
LFSISAQPPSVFLTPNSGQGEFTTQLNFTAFQIVQPSLQLPVATRPPFIYILQFFPTLLASDLPASCIACSTV